MKHSVVFAKKSGGRFYRRVIGAKGVKWVEERYNAVAVGCTGSCPCGGSGEGDW